MTQPRNQDIILTRGDDYSAVFTFTQPIADLDEIWFTVRTSYAIVTDTDNTDATLELTLTDADFVSTGIYTVELNISNTDTLTLVEDRYVYDVCVRTDAGKIYTTQIGKLKVLPDVTR